MPKLNTITGIDVGTSKVRAIIAQKPETSDGKPQVIGVGEANTFGMRKGLVVDIEETANSINESVEQAERMAGVAVEKAFVSIGSNDITCQVSKGAIAIGRADGEVTKEDVARVNNAAQAISLPNNKEIIHVIPKKYHLDNQKDLKDPVGMNGVRLEVESLIIQGSSPYLKNMHKCLHQAGISIEEMVLSPLAAQLATLNKRQRELGVALVNIGGGTTGIAVYEEGELLHMSIIPIGGNNITNDIAIGLRTSIEVAEDVKIKYGSCQPSEIKKKENIDLNKFDKNEESVVSRKHVAEIIEARMEEIFEMVNRELKSIDREGMLPAGAVMVGGTSKINGSVDLAKDILKLPTQNGFPREMGGIVDKVDDLGFATAVGLIFWGIEHKPISDFSSISIPGVSQMGSSIFGSVSKIKKWFRDFLP
ncbi:MAG: cell division protein FtsA [Candidatus Moranbacteria bacterium]|nr:cell division protein FtsA [Candidatus Moranbacteria bacterium]